MYTQAYATKCKGQKDQSSCVESIDGFLELEDVVEECMEDSFAGSDYDMDDNTLLFKQREHQVDSNIQHFPSLAINHVLYSGKQQDMQAIKATICQSLAGQPSQCSGYNSTTIPGLSTDHTITWIFVLVMGLVMCFLLYFARRQANREIRREMPDKINEAIADYFALKDSTRSEERL